MTAGLPEKATAPVERSGCSTSKTDKDHNTEEWLTVNVGEISFKIRPCPTAGRGVHQWAYGTWHTAREAGLSEAEADAVCDEYATRPLTRTDYPRDFPKTSKAAFRKPRANYRPEKLEAFAAKAGGFTAADMERKSPLPPDEVTPAGFLRCISQPGQRRLIFDRFQSQGQKLWECPPPEAATNDMELAAFVRPAAGMGTWFTVNPVDGQWRELPRLVSPHNPRGRTRRAEENLTAFPFVLLESDLAPADQWLAALALIRLPISAVYESGGKSVHALVKIDAATVDEWRHVVEERRVPLVMLGADEAAMTAVRLSRLPQCFRGEKGHWQRLLYLNGAPDGTPIIEQANRGNAAPTSNKQDGGKCNEG